MMPIAFLTRSAARRAAGAWDRDAVTYIAKVEAADGAPLSSKVRRAVNRFVRQCKVDASPVSGVSNWSAIKSASLLAGPSSMAGIVVPLKGPSPTLLSYVSGDLNPVTGLKGNGSTKYINTNRSNTADPADNRHAAVFISDNIFTSAYGNYLIGRNYGTGNPGSYFLSVLYEGGITRHQLRYGEGSGNQYALVSNVQGDPAKEIGLYGSSRRPNDKQKVYWCTPTATGALDKGLDPDPPGAGNILVFTCTMPITAVGAYRVSFYSSGEAVDFTTLKAAVNQYMEDIA